MPVVTRTNLCTNPSLEAGVTGWLGAGNPAPVIAQSAVRAQNRAKSLLITWAAGNVFLPGAYYALATVAGTQYTVSCYVYVPTGNPKVQLVIGSGGLLVGSTVSTLFDQWQRLSVTFTATAGAHNVILAPNSTPTAGQVCHLDSILAEQAPVAASYFDGASSGCQWTGTADLSTSQQLAGPLSITVNNDLANEPPRNVIYVTGAPGTTAQVNRTDADGGVRPVRGGDPAPLIGGQWAGADVEVPYGQPATYTVAPSDGSASVFVAVPALATTQARFVHPGVPSLSVKIFGWRDDSDRESDTGEAQHVIVGRENPIIITDGQRKGESYDAELKTETKAQMLAFRALIAGSVPVLLQLVYPFTDETVWEYVSIGKVQRARRSDKFGDPRRKFTFTCTVVDRPAGGVAAQRTIADAAVEVGTIEQFTARYSTITGATLGIPGT